MIIRLPALLFTVYFLLSGMEAVAQHQLFTNAPPSERLQRFWQYCTENLISDKDSAATCQWLIGIEKEANSLHDEQLKKYATYFRLCFRVLFSKDYQQYFAPGDFESVANVYRRAQVWAKQNRHTDIEAVCEHYIGEVYFYAAKYSPAFEYLLRADDMFLEIGYGNIPAISTYLYDLALNYYKFEEWDKALHYFLEATRHPFYAQWVELSTLNAIGLIYNEKQDWEKAKTYFRQTLTKATQYGNKAWVGIMLDNLGESFAERGQNDSALVYYVRSFHINETSAAPETGAFTALSIAHLQMKQNRLDSAGWYIRRGQELAAVSVMMDSATQLRFGAELMKALIALHKQKEDYKTALLYADSLDRIKYRFYKLLDDKIVSQVEAKRHIAELNLLQTEKRLSNFRLYVLVASLLLAGIISAILFSRYRRRKQRQITRAAQERERIETEKQRVEQQLLQAEQSLTAYLNTIKEKTSLIENLDTEIQRLHQSVTTTADLQGLTLNMEKLVSTTILTDEGWNYFRGLFEQVYPGFIHQLRTKYADLSPAETRMLVLTKLNLQSREVAQMLGISMDSLRKARYRLRKKLNLEEEVSFEAFIQQV